MDIMAMIKEELVGYIPTQQDNSLYIAPLYTPPTPMDMALCKPMSYYIALEQDKQQANPNGEKAYMTVR